MSNQNIPSQEWLTKYEEVKHIFSEAIPVNYQELFGMNEIFGKKLTILKMGEVNFPTGGIICCDPLVNISHKTPYFQRVPVGKFPLETLVIEVEEDHYRYMATRVKFSDNKVVRYDLAMEGNEDLSEADDCDYFGFDVDAGLGTIVDVKTREAYCDFEKNWYQSQENPEDSNIYDDFFAEEFAKSYQERPEFQREGGDWINFAIPNTDLSIPMVQSGWGDGCYPVYLGYDEKGNVCEVVIEFIPAIDWDDDEEEEGDDE